MFPQLLCSVNATLRHPLCGVNEKHNIVEVEGLLCLTQISSLITIGHFDRISKDKGECTIRVFQCDIDDLIIEKESLCVKAQVDEGGDTRHLYLCNKLDVESVANTLELCHDVCDLTLKLRSICRDFYFSGMYQSMKGDDFEGLLFADLIRDIPGETIADCGEALLVQESSPGLKDSLKSYRKPLNTRLICVFCDVDNYTQRNLEFDIHPYVPENFSEAPIHLCAPCKINWKRYRDHAKHSKRLIFPGEKNEEICAICSDCPESDLILCSGCPKSFCDSCLKRVLTTKELEEVLGDNGDWFCMSCHNGRGTQSTRSKEKMNSVSTGKRKKFSSVAQESSPRRVQVVTAKSVAKKLPSTQATSTIGGGKYEKVGGKRKSTAQSPEIVNLQAKFSSPPTAVSSKSPVSKRSSGSHDSLTLLPVSKELTEVDYFSQYFKISECICKEAERGIIPEATEDSCFLCKDGGDLIECDHHFGKSSACRKVYHDYCMGWAAEQTVNKEWICMRHYCSACGGNKPYYMCKYCPISICKSCPELFVERYNLPRHVKLPTPPLPEYQGLDIQLIACENCLGMFHKSTSNGSINGLDNSMRGLDVEMFPGVYLGPPGQKAVICNASNDLFNGKRRRTMQEITVNGKSEQTFFWVCYGCGKEIRSSSGKSRHKKSCEQFKSLRLEPTSRITYAAKTNNSFPVKSRKDPAQDQVRVS